MAKQGKRIDPNQMALDFDQKIEEYAALKVEILQAEAVPEDKCAENYEETCMQVATEIKRAIRSSKLSREQVVDEINAYFGWEEKETKSKKHLSSHMLNHYLSKPVQYPIPAFYLFAIQSITRSLEPVRALAEAADARVISGEEVRHMSVPHMRGDEPAGNEFLILDWKDITY